MAFAIGAAANEKLLNPKRMRNASQRKEYMKPTPPIAASPIRHEIVARADHRNAPQVEQSYHCGSIDEFKPRGGKITPSFRDLSGGYFNYEAPRAFATEAVVFGAILLTVIVPLITSANAVIHLLRSVNL